MENTRAAAKKAADAKRQKQEEENQKKKEAQAAKIAKQIQQTQQTQQKTQKPASAVPGALLAAGNDEDFEVKKGRTQTKKNVRKQRDRKDSLDDHSSESESDYETIKKNSKK